MGARPGSYTSMGLAVATTSVPLKGWGFSIALLCGERTAPPGGRRRQLAASFGAAENNSQHRVNWRAPYQRRICTRGRAALMVTPGCSALDWLC